MVLGLKGDNMAKIDVLGTEITVIATDNDDYISLTDMLKAKDGEFEVDPLSGPFFN